MVVCRTVLSMCPPQRQLLLLKLFVACSTFIDAQPSRTMTAARNSGNGRPQGQHNHDLHAKDTTYDVVIVGAGVSGVAAAAALSQAGLTNITVLEAANTTGGRIQSIPFADGRIEIGANWIHGVRGSAADSGTPSFPTNPVWLYAHSLGLSTRLLPGSCSNVSGYGLYFANGTKPTQSDVMARYTRAATTADCLNRTGNQINLGSTLSVATALAHCGWAAKDALDVATEWEMTSADWELAPNDTALSWCLPDATYQRLGPDDHFVFDQRPRGYASVVDAIAAEGRVPESAFSLSTRVETIALTPTGDKVVVTAEDGKRVTAQVAIVTLPLGVMQRRHASIFQSPQLPTKQADALEQFAMGNFTKIFVRWPTRVWPDRGVQWLVAPRDDDVDGSDPMEFHDLGLLDPALNGTLFTYVVGKGSVKWEAIETAAHDGFMVISRTDAEATLAIVNRLSSAFGGNVTFPPPGAIHVTRHGLNPLSFGAYSTTRPGFSWTQFRDMIAPLGGGAKFPQQVPRVIFAGEHTCASLNAYTHGAFYSGLRAARDALSVLGRPQPNGTALLKPYGDECEQSFARPSPD